MEKTNFLETILSIFRSIKLSIVVFILLILSSIIGTLIAQKSQTNVPIQSIYSPEVISIFEFFDFFNVYHSWWFTLLMFLLIINLIVCTLNKIPSYLKIIKKDFSKINTETLSKSGAYKKIKLKKFDADIITILGIFPKAKTINNSGTSFMYSDRGKYSYFNVTFVHTSILLIMIGGVIGSIFGINGSISLLKNEAKNTFIIDSANNRHTGFPLGFTLKCNNFTIDYYDRSNQRPKQYYSDLEIIENDNSILKKTIYVNEPLSHNDFNFYQSSYGSNPTFNLLIQDGESKQNIMIGLREKKNIGKSGQMIIPVDYKKDFIMQGHGSIGSAVLVHIADKGGMSPPLWFFKNHPEFNNNESRQFKVILTDVKEDFYTVLQVSKQPGIWIIWVGFTLLIISLFFVAFYKHERLYFVFNKKDSTLEVALKTNAPQSLAKDKFDNLINKIESRLL